MNLLNTYIETIHSEQKVKTAFGYMVEVDLTEDCYGVVERRRRVFSEPEWDKIKKQGYFLS